MLRGINSSVAAAFAALAAVGLLYLYVAVEPARATFPGGNGDIVSAGWDEEDYDHEIYRVRANGGTPINVTNNATEDREPAFSPNGKRIAYSAWDGNDYEIFTIPISGGTRTRVTANTTSDKHPTWSPSGSQLAYQGHDGADYEIYKVGATGGTPTKLTDNADDDDVSPAWSPKGDQIAYSQHYPLGFGLFYKDVYTIPPGGGEPTIRHREASKGDFDPSPAWSPDGSKFAYVSNDGTDLEIVAGGVEVTNNNTDDRDPAYSPDGSKVVYRGQDRPDNDFELFTAPSGGGRATKLTEVGWVASPDWQALPDTTPPAITKAPTTQQFAENRFLGASLYVLLDWLGADNAGGSGLTGYELQHSLNGGVYTNVSLPSATATSITPYYYDGETHRYRVRARDGSGNWSAWVAGPLAVVDIPQDDDPSVTYLAGTWTSVQEFQASGWNLTHATASGAKARFTFRGREVAFSTTKGPDRGRARACVDPGTASASCTTIDLYSTSTSYRQFIPLKKWPTSASHTVEVTVLGTKNAASSGTRVDIDAFAVLR